MLKEQENYNLLLIVKVFFGLMFGLVLFPTIIKSIVIGLFLLSILFLNYKRRFVVNKMFLFINSSTYFLFLLTLFYSYNLTEASLKLQTTLSLLIFPVVFSFLKTSDILEILKNTKVYLFIFIVSVFIYNVTPFLWYYITHYSLQDIIKHYPTIIEKDIGKYGIHPIYMSMHCAISILFTFYILRNSIHAPCSTQVQSIQMYNFWITPITHICWSRQSF